MLIELNVMYPLRTYLALSEEGLAEWNQSYEKIDVEMEKSEAAFTNLSNSIFDDSEIQLIYIPLTEAGPEQARVLAVHEIVHAVENIWRFIGEIHPGNEARAYLHQSLAEQIFEHIDRAARRRGKKKVESNRPPRKRTTSVRGRR